MKNHSCSGASAIDAAGATASLACAIHCALMPLVITLLPLAGLGFLASEPVEWLLLTLSATLGVCSLCLGYRTHRSQRALMVLAAGLALAAIGRIAEHGGTSLFLARARAAMPLISGGLLDALSHGLNFYLCRVCPSCHAENHCQHEGAGA